MRKSIHWFIDNPVTVNLLALIIIVGGIMLFSTKIIVEFFPDSSSSVVNITTVLKGATPTEVETGVTELVEDALREVEGIEDVASTSAENLSRVSVNLASGTNTLVAIDAIRNKVNAISGLPDNAEVPVVELQSRLRAVGDLAISGTSDSGQAFTERELREIAERVRTELQDRLQSQVQINTGGFRKPELSVEIDQAKLIA